MRKRNALYVTDIIMWNFIYLFPLLIMLAMSIKSSTPFDLTAFMSGNGFNVLSSGIIYNSLEQFFGSSGVLPLFSAGNNGVLLYMSYFVSCMLLHLAVDFLLFIPRLAQKYMDKFVRLGD